MRVCKYSKDEEITPEILIQMMIIYYLSKFPTKIIKVNIWKKNNYILYHYFLLC